MAEAAGEGAAQPPVPPDAAAMKAQELAAVRAAVSVMELDVCRADLVRVVLSRTAHSRIAVRFQFPEGYPREAAVYTELSSPTVPVPFLRKLQAQCDKECEGLIGQPQMLAVLRRVRAVVEENRFLPCWKELRRTARLVEEESDFAAEEATGQLRLRLRCGKYHLMLRMTVPEQYPDDGVEFSFANHNFHAKLITPFQAQAQEIVRRCLAGTDPEVAAQMSNPIRLPASAMQSSSDGPRVRLTADEMHNLKHDVRVLKQVSDLRQVDTSRESRNGTLVHNTKERKNARRELRQLSKAEMARDQAREAVAAEMDAKEREQATGVAAAAASGGGGAGGGVGGAGGSGRATDSVARPSMFAVAHFVADEFVRRLPQEMCQGCGERILSENPRQTDLSDDNPRRPMRVFCGHWFHWTCLNTWLTTPPFGRACTICERRIYHPDWPADTKILEKAWATKQAREREVADVTDFLDVGDAFRRDPAPDGDA